MIISANPRVNNKLSTITVNNFEQEHNFKIRFLIYRQSFLDSSIFFL